MTSIYSHEMPETAQGSKVGEETHNEFPKCEPRVSFTGHPSEGPVVDIPSVNPELYAQKVLAFSKRSIADSIYTGQHYAPLARWLISPYQPFGSMTRDKRPEDSPFEFALLSTLSHQGLESNMLFSIPETLWKHENSSSRARICNKILFLRGYPTAQWLTTIGAKYHADPEFLLRHLGGLVAPGDPAEAILPSVPSMKDIVHLDIQTIGSWNDSHPTSSLNALREECNRSMAVYWDQLFKGRLTPTGYPIVRQFLVHDKKHFSFSQRISIHLCPGKKDSWTGLFCSQSLGQFRSTKQSSVIVWLDNGLDLSKTLSGPWLNKRNNSWGVILHPVIQYRNLLSIRNHHENRRGQTDGRLHQSATHLHLDYGSTLQPELMEADPFYAMNEIFRFAAAAESQFLNMLQQKVEVMADPDQAGSIGDLKKTKDVLDRHVRQLEGNLETIKLRGGQSWPKAPLETLKKRADEAAELLESDFGFLLKTARQLSITCEAGITILMSDTQFREAQKGIAQGNSVLKLSLIALFFIPLSFTTSFFGMNFPETSSPSLSLWLWFAISAPLLLLTFLFWNLDFSSTWGKTRQLLVRLMS